MRSPVGIGRRETGDPRGQHALAQYDRIVHVGIILPNFGEHASPAGVCAVADAAEELGFDSVWATEHIIVGAEAVEPYGRVLDPLCTLSWLAGSTERIGLGTSIVLVPLHHPIRLAKEVATLQELCGGRFRLGAGVGWHEDEFRFMGVGFRDRGRRADEALRLMRALWSGKRTFHGDYWSFENATFEPLPSRVPEIWVGGGSDRAVRRTRELGDVWHPTRGVGPDRVRDVKERFPELRVVPRLSGGSADEIASQAEDFRAAGCEGVVAGFAGEPTRAIEVMREFADRHR
ncbi:MAG: TIGR03619 family F420-dependent LLM class oxidoreductase [Actinobacteria bacterium]|nr:MAG: TIGR03619 family F420-dependent LLM class oxidoreductase [Actinomycetota bacterium]